VLAQEPVKVQRAVVRILISMSSILNKKTILTDLAREQREGKYQTSLLRNFARR